ncbi:MAG: undecaprenyl-diphosphate phosphatase [Evtepia sp.]
MSILSSIFLGLVQGVAEFLPISSSGHLSLFQHFFGMASADGNLFFDVLPAHWAPSLPFSSTTGRTFWAC